MTTYLTRHASRSDLVLPNGERADQLRLTPLRRELQRLKIPGMTAEMGKDALLDVYAAHVASVAGSLPKTGMQARDISATVAKQAAQVIAQQAAGVTTPAPASPSAPIASMRV